jgi:NTF2-related export protein 1/2
VDSFYPCFKTQAGRDRLSTFYIRSIDEAKPNICINGNVLSTPEEYKQMVNERLSDAQFDVTSVNSHVINANYNVGVDESKLGPEKDGRKSSIAVLVGGTIQYGTGFEKKAFTETFLLVPNAEAYKPKAGTESNLQGRVIALDED